MYFERALYLDRNYLTAWALMGHELIEMKNPHADVDAYRKAVGKELSIRTRFFVSPNYLSLSEINHQDYRTRYGLGHTYEALRMQYHAMYYFQR